MPGEKRYNENCKLLPPSEMSPLATCRERENGTRHFPRWSSPRGIACLESQRENVSALHPTMALPGWPCSLGDKGYEKSDGRNKEPSQESRSLRSSSRDRQRLASTASASCPFLRPPTGPHLCWCWCRGKGHLGCQHQHRVAWAQGLARPSLSIGFANSLGKLFLINCEM